MRSAMLLLAGVTSLGACDGARPQPVTARSSNPPAAESSVAPLGAASASVAAAAETISPPDPGRVDLVFTGDFAKHAIGDGAECDDGFWIRSTDVLGRDAVPQWVLLTADQKIQVQIGPIAQARVFNAPLAGGVARRGNEIRIDVLLTESNGKKRGKVHLQGTITCGKPASGAVPEAIARMLREESSSPVRPYCTQDFGREQTRACVSVVVPGKPEGKARDLILRLRKKLPAGWVAFIGTSRWLGDEKLDGSVEVVVGPGRDQFDILRLARSNAINYEMATEALVKKLRAYHAIVPIDIWHAETDTIELDLADVPADLKAFAKDVYDFCPDIVDQGVGSVAKLEKEIARSKRLFLWWD